MLKIEQYDVVGWEHAIRSMRNPMNSWNKSDTWDCADRECVECPLFSSEGCGDHFNPVIGQNDFGLMKKLVKAGSDHRKFMRMITVYVDIYAPLYWWKEFDTYKVGTVANSCSTMHKIADKEFELSDFSCEHLIGNFSECNGIIFENGIDTPKEMLSLIIGTLNTYRHWFLETKDKKYWWQMIQLLPSSYNQKRTVMLNYEVLRNMYHARKNHKLDEWHDFCDWVESLPYSELITGKFKEE